MKFTILILTIYIFTYVYGKKNCYPIPTPKPVAGFSNEACPNRPYIPTFDIEQFKGNWYNIQVYPSIYFSSLNCHIFDFVPTGPYTYNDTYCEKPNEDWICRESQAVHSDQDGKFDFVVEDQIVGSGYYFYIDYESYFIFYVCQDLDNGQSQTTLFIGSRDRTLSDELLAEAYGKIKNHFDVDGLVNVEQDENVCTPRAA